MVTLHVNSVILVDVFNHCGALTTEFSLIFSLPILLIQSLINGKIAYSNHAIILVDD